MDKHGVFMLIHEFFLAYSSRQRRDGGARRDRTADHLLAKQVLSQLSYGPVGKWWVWVDLNYRPHPYQGCALTN